MSVSARSGLVGLGSVAAPIAIFLFLKVSIGLGPSASPAQPAGADPARSAPAAGPGPAINPEQSRALAWLAALKVEANMPSPLGALPGAGAGAPGAMHAPPGPLDALKLSAVLTTADGDWASINGKVYRAGDAVPGGFVVRAIDTRGRRVELTCPDHLARWLSREK